MLYVEQIPVYTTSFNSGAVENYFLKEATESERILDVERRGVFTIVTLYAKRSTIERLLCLFKPEKIDVRHVNDERLFFELPCDSAKNESRYLFCATCGLRVSSLIPTDVTTRAVIRCSECYEKEREENDKTTV